MTDENYDFGSIKKKKKKWRKAKTSISLIKAKGKTEPVAPNHIFFNSMNAKSGRKEIIRAAFGRWLLVIVPSFTFIMILFTILLIISKFSKGTLIVLISYILILVFSLIFSIVAHLITDHSKMTYFIKRHQDSFRIEVGPKKLNVKAVVRYHYFMKNIEVNTKHEIDIKDIKWVHRFSDTEYLMEHPIGYFFFNRGCFNGSLAHFSADIDNLYLVNLTRSYLITHHVSDKKASSRPFLLLKGRGKGPKKFGFEGRSSDQIILDIPNIKEFRNVISTHNPKIKFYF